MLIVAKVRALRGRGLDKGSYLTAAVGDRLAVGRAAAGADPVWNEDFEAFVRPRENAAFRLRQCDSSMKLNRNSTISLKFERRMMRRKMCLAKFDARTDAYRVP